MQPFERVLPEDFLVIGKKWADFVEEGKSNGRIYRLFRIEIMTERAKSAIINDVDKKCGIFFEELL